MTLWIKEEIVLVGSMLDIARDEVVGFVANEVFPRLVDNARRVIEWVRFQPIGRIERYSRQIPRFW